MTANRIRNELKQSIRDCIPWQLLETFICCKLLFDNRLFAGSMGVRDFERAAIKERGINVIGFHEIPFGLGQGVCSTSRSLEAAGIPVNRINFTHADIRNNFWKKTPVNVRFTGNVNIIQVNPLEIGTVVKRFGRHNFSSRYNIGYWVWEQGKLPLSWKLARRYVQEIWTPSTYTAGVISSCLPGMPVSVIPHCIDAPDLDNLPFPEELGLPCDKKLLLCMFDMNSTTVRKNPEGSLQAILRAAAGRDDICVVVKTREPEKSPQAFSRLLQLLKQSGVEYKAITTSISRNKLFALLCHAAALVSLHRSEGFGLFLAEAMAAGCPVIATGYSGNMDFMTEENSWPVSYQLIANREYCPPYYRGYLWAEPDIDDAAEKISIVLDNPQLARDKANRAKKNIAEDFSVLQRIPIIV